MYTCKQLHASRTYISDRHDTINYIVNKQALLQKLKNK